MVSWFDVYEQAAIGQAVVVALLVEKGEPASSRTRTRRRGGGGSRTSGRRSLRHHPQPIMTLWRRRRTLWRLHPVRLKTSWWRS